MSLNPEPIAGDLPEFNKRKRIWCAVVMEAKKQITASMVGECCDVTRKVSLNHTIIRDIDPVFLPA
jgi:hypothetical protein